MNCSRKYVHFCLNSHIEDVTFQHVSTNHNESLLKHLKFYKLTIDSYSAADCTTLLRNKRALNLKNIWWDPCPEFSINKLFLIKCEAKILEIDLKLIFQLFISLVLVESFN